MRKYTIKPIIFLLCVTSSAIIQRDFIDILMMSSSIIKTPVSFVRISVGMVMRICPQIYQAIIAFNISGTSSVIRNFWVFMSHNAPPILAPALPT
jgi:hypothetical protein